ncbi:DUF3857 domain-containing protein [Marinirhabdus gelatinilytica]|uniref:Uncharacterized protein DUF3857 n=1 Tax=Marinirhabdus gelatinilytica TaxID=1703343 RepID=A0A370Q788_9FLAO|nr:DUF3857 domain-containing protein [Marinirhabdus gelatinilytica]RDK84245.1 uncharacterized protein DUF3857 [Marinirhabdus gelatinilytica]
MKFKYLLILLLAFTVAGTAQNYKLGKVSKEELKEKAHPSYPNANASVLYRDYSVSYVFTQGQGFVQITKVHERIKIYNNQGFDWATRTVRTYNDGTDKESFDVKGYTFTLENGSVEKEKLRNEGIFEERASKYRVDNKFTMPNISPGSIVEYEYTIESPFPYIEDVDLQYTIPIKKENIKIEVPEYYVFNIQLNPKSPLSFSFEQNTREKKINLRERSGLGTVNYNKNFRRNTMGRNTTGTKEYSYKENIYTLEENNIPPLKEEVYVDNLKNYQAKSLWELAMVNNPNGIPKRYATTWEAVAKSVYEDDDFVNQIKKNDYYQADLAAVTKGAASNEEKMVSILNLVKSKVTWNNYVGFIPEKGVKKAYREGTGNTADINLMLLSMLQNSGLDAFPVLLSTSENGIPVYPTREGFNYVIAAVNSNGNVYLLDATDPFSQVNMLPRRAMNWQGRLIRPDGTSNWVGLYPGYVSQKLTYVQAEINDQNVLVKVRERKGGHFAKEYRNKYVATSDKLQMDGVDTGSEAVEISEFEAKDLESLKDNMSISYTANSSSLVEEIGGDLYISPMLFFAQTENPFKSDSREYPIFFEYPKSQKYNISLKIPEGYKVKSLPEAIKADLANNMGSYTYLLKEAPGILQLAVSLDLNTPIVLPQDYEFIKGMFAQITEKEKEKIVFTKI